MQLYCNGVFMGTLNEYFYETPWASAHITPHNPQLYTRLCNASRFLDHDIDEDWGELSFEAEEQAYARRLAGYGITQADVDCVHRGVWEIRAAQHADWNGPISFYRCSSDGLVEWRW